MGKSSWRWSLVLWVLGAVFGLCLLGAGTWFLWNYAWVPFYPVCVAGHKSDGDPETFTERYITAPFRPLQGRMRPEFEEAIKRNLYEQRISESGIYVTINYFLDPDLFWNFTTRAIRSLIAKEIRVVSELGREINPFFFDGNGNFLRKEFEELDEKYGYVGELHFSITNCEVYRFFAIEGALPPKNMRYAFDDPYHPVKRVENEKILRYFIKKFDR